MLYEKKSINEKNIIFIGTKKIRSFRLKINFQTKYIIKTFDFLWNMSKKINSFWYLSSALHYKPQKKNIYVIFCNLIKLAVETK